MGRDGRAREDLLAIRRAHQDLADDLRAQGRKGLRLLDEQIMLLGASCPDGLFAAREEALFTLRRMDRSFVEYDEGFGALLDK